jgi:MYXO-CTERM domain-containing protein
VQVSSGSVTLRGLAVLDSESVVVVGDRGAILTTTDAGACALAPDSNAATGGAAVVWVAHYGAGRRRRVV